jgi:hypothetical protein
MQPSLTRIHKKLKKNEKTFRAITEEISASKSVVMLLLGFLTAGVSFTGSSAPFAVALFGVALKYGIIPFVVLCITILGLTLAGAQQALSVYILTGLLYAGIHVLIKNKKNGLKAVAIALAYFSSSVTVAALLDRTFYDFLYGFLYAALTGLLYVIYDRAVSGIDDLSKGLKLNGEQYAALYIAVFLALSAMTNYRIANVNIGVIIYLFVVMICSYYGTMAQLIERPMTTTLAEYPDEAKEYYGYDPQKALAKFKEAGYEQKDGKLVKNGQQLVLNVYIGGDGIGDHPGYAMLTQAANDLKNMGGELIIHDVQFSVLQAAMNSGEADMFVLAWGTVTTCDQRSQYMTGGGQNRTNISNKELDNILEQIVVTMDLKERKALVAKALDIVMEEAVEMPLYQRKNGYVYNPVTVDISSLPETSTYWSYENVLYKIKLN